MVTFTRAAAREMKERYLRASGLSSTKVIFGTLHGVFYAILRGTRETSEKRLVAGEEKRRMLFTLLEDLGEDREQRREQAELLEKEFSRVKKCKNLQEFASEALEKEKFVQAFFAYGRMLEGCHGMDFDDLAGEVQRLLAENTPVRELWQERFAFVLVDEFQDIDREQYELLKLLAAPQDNLFLVGDDDQSIYGFRGAEPGVMQQVPQDFPGLARVVLDINYRCQSQIMDCAERLITHNRVRFAKKARPVGDAPGCVRGIAAGDKRKEWQLLAKEIRHQLQMGREAGQIAVLTRTHAGIRGILPALWEQGIPTQTDAGMHKLSDHFIWKDIFAWLQIASGKRDRAYYLRILNKPSRYLRREDFPEPEVNWERCYAGLQDDPVESARLRRFRKEVEKLQGLVPLAVLYCIQYTMGYREYLETLAEQQHREAGELLATLDILRQLAAGKRTVQEYIRAVEEYVWPVRAAGICVSTLHASKGLEYETVYIPDVNEGNIPWHEAKTVEAVEEERRLLYVGMTRAKEELCLLWTDDREGNLIRPSRFLAETGIIEGLSASIQEKRRI